jgi:CRP-like cAMP-binding protein
LESLSSNKSCTIYKRGQAIFQEGNKPFGIYCLTEGKVKITKIGSEGKEQIIRFAKPGDTMGYRALLSDTRYSASAIALEECKACFISSNDFNQLIAQNYLIAKDMMRMLSNALADAEVSIAHLATKPVRERIAEALLLLKKVYGETGETQFSISLTREDLSSLVGTAKETAIRFLSELKEEGVISTHGSMITILDPAKLIKISQMYD